MNNLYPPDASYEWALWPGVFNLFSPEARAAKKGKTFDAIWTREGWKLTEKIGGARIGEKKAKPLFGETGIGIVPMNGEILKWTEEDFRRLIEEGG